MPGDHGIATYVGPPGWRILRLISRTAEVQMMFASHRQIHSSATRFVFGIVLVLVLMLSCGLASRTAKAQLRIGIGVGGIGGGIGGVLLDDSYRRQRNPQVEQYQRSQGATESRSTKKATKAKNQKPKRDESKIAKDSPPKAKSPEPVASAPQTTPLTAGPPPTPDNFGQ